LGAFPNAYNIFCFTSLHKYIFNSVTIHHYSGLLASQRQVNFHTVPMIMNLAKSFPMMDIISQRISFHSLTHYQLVKSLPTTFSFCIFFCSFSCWNTDLVHFSWPELIHFSFTFSLSKSCSVVTNYGAFQKYINHSLLPALLNVTQAVKWNVPIANHLGCITSRELGVRWQKPSSEK
jgi:hypothetical protein